MAEKYSPWTIVNLVFEHLADRGLHPVLGESGDPARPAAELLRALGIEPGSDADGPAALGVQQTLAELRAKMMPDVE